jgi:hypothetical protein
MVFADLARRRPWLSSAHLALSFERLGAAPTEALVARGRDSTLVLSVPKRVAATAPLRNRVRRVLRESWRLSAWHRCPSDVRLAVLMRLRGLPMKGDLACEGALAKAVDGADAKRSKSKGSARTRGLQRQAQWRARLPDRALKRQLRAEADALFERLYAAKAGAAAVK